MSKCRIIDRVAYTKGELKFIDTDNIPQEKQPAKDISPEPERKGDKCPICGQYTLHHAEGCETCYACGYSKCAITW